MVIRLACITLFLALGLAPSIASAANDTAGVLRIASNGMSLDAAVHQVKQQTGGRILSAETVTRNGRRLHRIKVLLPDGTVRVMTFNAG